MAAYSCREFSQPSRINRVLTSYTMFWLTLTNLD